jgi:hypothetical protein
LKTTPDKKISGDILLFQNCYTSDPDTSTYAIKYHNRKYYYWLNNQWNLDNRGNHIKNTISINLQSLYLNINNMDNFQPEEMIKYQMYISNMDTDKYKNNLLLEIKELISIENFNN